MRTATIERRITELALSFPESYEDRPWGDFPVFKVGQNKVFGWVVTEDDAVRVTVKLTAEEREIAHLLPYVSVARYVGRRENDVFIPGPEFAHAPRMWFWVGGIGIVATILMLAYDRLVARRPAV